MLIILFCVFWTMVNSAHLHTKRGDCTSSSGKGGRCSEPLVGCARQYISVGGECPIVAGLSVDCCIRAGCTDGKEKLNSKDEKDQRTEKRQLYQSSQFTENVPPAESFQLAQSAESAEDVQIAQDVELPGYCSRSECPKDWTKSSTETATSYCQDYNAYCCMPQVIVIPGDAVGSS